MRPFEQQLFFFYNVGPGQRSKKRGEGKVLQLSYCSLWVYTLERQENTWGWQLVDKSREDIVFQQLRLPKLLHQRDHPTTVFLRSQESSGGPVMFPWYLFFSFVSCSRRYTQQRKGKKGKWGKRMGDENGRWKQRGVSTFHGLFIGAEDGVSTVTAMPNCMVLYFWNHEWFCLSKFSSMSNYES